VPRLTRITTRTGDDGTTALGFGGRRPKDDLRIETFGTVDELNAALGLARTSTPPEAIDAVLGRLQNHLFHLGSDLCVPEDEKARHPVPTIEERHVAELDELVERWNAELPALENFVLPGGSPAAAALHLARTVSRRAERCLVALAREEAVGPWTLPFLNRLSDLLFVLARAANRGSGREDLTWDSRA